MASKMGRPPVEDTNIDNELLTTRIGLWCQKVSRLVDVWAHHVDQDNDVIES